MKYTCSMETVQQNGRFTLFSIKFLSIYSILYGFNARLPSKVEFLELYDAHNYGVQVHLEENLFMVWYFNKLSTYSWLFLFFSIWYSWDVLFPGFLFFLTVADKRNFLDFQDLYIYLRFWHHLRWGQQSIPPPWVKSERGIPLPIF